MAKQPDPPQPDLPPIPRRALLAGPLLLATAGARAEEAYPAGPVTLVAPFATGGAADLAARTLAAFAPRHLPNRNASIRVENRVGASGAIGTLSVARAKPDGATLLLARVAPCAILPAIDSRTPYAWDGFTVLGLLDETPFVLCVRADAPWRNVGELLSALRERLGRLAFGTTGPATLPDLGVRALFIAAGLPFDAAVAQPHAGGGAAVAALVAGEVQFLGGNLSELSGSIGTGTLRPLLVGGRQRLRGLPDVPSAGEEGFELLVPITGWNALYGPPGLPEPVVAAWGGVLRDLAKDGGWLAATRRAGALPRLLGPEETRDFVRDQAAVYRDLAKRMGLV
ncbi:MAG TPA: tripartite tricarboxylate transporter substrate binding protein [Crenalkalicoccus sp.]|jgi:tripartite-type tricarboxylate transporter receptor subunit TctC|nr:tripartite tricarboxylate transporter substrate binding protein [Crenalkalicoccus sp.]